MADLFVLRRICCSPRKVSIEHHFAPQELPLPSVDEELLTTSEADATQRDCNAEVVRWLDLTNVPD